MQGGRPILEHADVKRMLLLQKAYAEGAYALCMYAASLHDAASGGDAKAAKLLDVSTEIVKSWPSEWSVPRLGSCTANVCSDGMAGRVHHQCIRSPACVLSLSRVVLV